MLTAPLKRQALTWMLVATLLAALLVFLGPVLSPFAAAAVLAYALEPLVRGLSRRHVPRPLAVLGTLLLTVCVMAAAALLIVPIVQHQGVQIRQRLPALAASLTEQWLPQLSQHLGVELRLDAASVRSWVAEQISNGGEALAATVLTYAKTGSNLLLQVIGMVFLVPVVSFYLLVDWDRLVARTRSLVPPRWRSPVDAFVAQANAILGQYIRGQALVMLALAGWYATGLWLGGYALWLPIGLLTGLLIAIPYLGFALGLSFSLLAGLLELGALKTLIVVGIVYGGGQLLESMVLTPRLVGERIGLHPLAVIFALLAFGNVFGFVGVLLALPVSAVLAVAVRHLYRAWVHSDVFGR
jgi:predicted PurR-regulated permease PerM